jgi:hypothetical protein
MVIEGRNCCCYLLGNLSGSASYVGATNQGGGEKGRLGMDPCSPLTSTDLRRRLLQHNGQRAGGASRELFASKG